MPEVFYEFTLMVIMCLIVVEYCCIVMNMLVQNMCVCDALYTFCACLVWKLATSWLYF